MLRALCLFSEVKELGYHITAFGRDFNVSQMIGPRLSYVNDGHRQLKISCLQHNAIARED